MANIAIEITIALAAAAGCGILVRKLGLPVIVGYMIGGILVGPHLSGLVTEVETIDFLGEVGVVLLLFALGLSFSIDELRKVGKVAILGGTIQMTATALLGFGLGELMGWDWAASIFFGCMIALSSTMVIMKALMDKGELDTTHGRIIMGILLVDDISLIPMMILLPALGSTSGVDMGELGLGLLKAVFFIAAIIFLGKVVVPKFLAWVQRMRSNELFLLTVILISVVAAGSATALGVSDAMGAFMAGLIIGQSRFARQALTSIIPLRDLFAAMFFVSLGMLANIPYIIENLWLILAIMLAIMIGKSIFNYTMLRGFRYNLFTAITVGLGMAQIGEFSMVLGGLGVSEGILTADMLSVAAAVAILTMTITPLTISHNQAVYNFVKNNKILGLVFRESKHQSNAILDEPIDDLSRHAIICGHNRQGAAVTSILKKRGFKYVIIESDPVIATELKETGENVIYGDASAKGVLQQAHADKALTVAITYKVFTDIELTAINALALNPRITIIATAESQEIGNKLLDIGVTEIVYSEVEATLEIARHTLKRMGATTVETQYLLNKAREAEEEESVPMH